MKPFYNIWTKTKFGITLSHSKWMLHAKKDRNRPNRWRKIPKMWWLTKNTIAIYAPLTAGAEKSIVFELNKLPNLNQQLPNLNQKLSSLNQKLPNLNQKLPNLNQKLPNLNQKIPNLNQKQSNLNQNHSITAKKALQFVHKKTPSFLCNVPDSRRQAKFDLDLNQKLPNLKLD